MRRYAHPGLMVGRWYGPMATSVLPLPGMAAKTKRASKPNPTTAAREVAAALAKDGRVVGMTKGQFSLLDLIRSVLARTETTRSAVCIL